MLDFAGSIDTLHNQKNPTQCFTGEELYAEAEAENLSRYTNARERL